MISLLARRTFSSRSAIRAPPAPPSASTVPSHGAPSMIVRSGRVAMLPKASEIKPLPSTVSHVSTASDAARPAQDYIAVGTVSVASEDVAVMRMGEDH